MTKDRLYKRQKGAVLVISLFILVVITLIGLSAIQTTTLEEKMSGNMHDHDLAFQAAESALKDGERNFIETQVTDPFNDIANDSNGANGLYGPDDLMPTASALLKKVNWNNITDSREFTFNGVNNVKNPLHTTADPPLVKIRRLPPPMGSEIGGVGKNKQRDVIFVVTARGTGGSTQSQVILQTRYLKKFTY